MRVSMFRSNFFGFKLDVALILPLIWMPSTVLLCRLPNELPTMWLALFCVNPLMLSFLVPDAGPRGEMMLKCLLLLTQLRIELRSMSVGLNYPDSRTVCIPFFRPLFRVFRPISESRKVFAFMFGSMRQISLISSYIIFLLFEFETPKAKLFLFLTGRSGSTKLWLSGIQWLGEWPRRIFSKLMWFSLLIFVLLSLWAYPPEIFDFDTCACRLQTSPSVCILSILE